MNKNNSLITIKTIGWTSLIITSIAAIYYQHKIIVVSLLLNKIKLDEDVMTIYDFSGPAKGIMEYQILVIYLILLVITSYVITRLKKWALITYHTLSFIIVIAEIGYITFLFVTIDFNLDNIAKSFAAINNLIFLITSCILLIIANNMLWNRRVEFRYN